MLSSLPQSKERRPDHYAVMFAAGQRAATEAAALPSAWRNAVFSIIRILRFSQLWKQTRTKPDAMLFHR